MKPVLPFTLKVAGKDEFKGLRAESTSFVFHGIARLEGETLILEWAGTARVQRVDPLSVRDEELKLPAETLIIPVHRLRSAEVAGRLWRMRLELSAGDLTTLAAVPSENQSVVRLWIRRRDRELAAAFAARLNQALATPPLATPPDVTLLDHDRTGA
jgi:hypothetical protein